MGFHVVPALSVLKTPPEATATYHVLRLTGSTATSVMRPDINAGPILRSFKPETRLELIFVASSSSSLSCATTGSAHASTNANRLSTTTSFFMATSFKKCSERGLSAMT